MPNGLIPIATATSRRATRWRNQEVPWGDLAKRLETPTRTAETVAEWQRMSKAQRDERKDVGGFVGGVLSGGKRRADSIRLRRLLTLDLDHMEKNTPDPWDSWVMLIGAEAALYSTHSHTPESPRYRIVCPLSRDATPDEYVALAHRVAGDIGIDLCDDTTFEPHRLMYWPSVPMDATYRFERYEGPWLDVDETLARYVDWRDSAQWPVSSRKAEVVRKLASKQGDPRTKPGVVGAFCRVHDIHSAINAYLPDVYAACDGERYTYAKGSSVGGLVVYENGAFAYSHHGTDPASGRLCNAFDLVRLHMFGNKDEEVAQGTPINRWPSYVAMCQLALSDEAVSLNMAMERTKSLEALWGEVDPAEKGEWRKLLKHTDKGVLAATIANIEVILDNDILLRDAWYTDIFSDRVNVSGDLPWRALAARETPLWTDADDAALHGYVEYHYGIDNAQKTVKAWLHTCALRRRHPVREYLEGLEWDGVKRLETVLVTALNAKDSPYVRAVTVRAFVGAVARIMQPGCKHDNVLSLIGEQGCGKSTFLAAIGLSWFSDSLRTTEGKEAYEALRGAWIIEMGEMAAMSKSEVEQVKHFLSKKVDSYRPAYGRNIIDFPRQCAFFGTTNDPGFLRDTTGGRRFWPVDVARGDIGYMTQENVNQLWAEAVNLYNGGLDWTRLPADIEDMAKAEQEGHTEEDVQQAMLETWLEREVPVGWKDWGLDERLNYWQDDFDSGVHPETEPRQYVCILEVWVELFGGNIRQKCDVKQARAIGAMLTRAKWVRESAPVRLGKVYGKAKVFSRPT